MDIWRKFFMMFLKLQGSEQSDSMAYETVLMWIKKTGTEFLVCCSDHIKIDRLSRENWKLIQPHFVELPWVQQNHGITNTDTQRDSWLLMSMYKALNIVAAFIMETSGWFQLIKHQPHQRGSVSREIADCAKSEFYVARWYGFLRTQRQPREHQEGFG